MDWLFHCVTIKLYSFYYIEALYHAVNYSAVGLHVFKLLPNLLSHVQGMEGYLSVAVVVLGSRILTEINVLTSNLTRLGC